MTSEFVPPRKAVVALGLITAGRAAETPATLPRSALAEHLPAADRGATRQVVEEALAAGLHEFIFITEDGAAVSRDKPRQVILPRHESDGTLEQALCTARRLVGEEPFVVIASPAMNGRGILRRLLESYRREGGNLVTVKSAETLRRKGTFATIQSEAAGHYLLQPAILGALAEDPAAGLAGALLAQAEAWPVTAVPLDFESAPAGVGRSRATTVEAAE